MLPIMGTISLPVVFNSGTCKLMVKIKFFIVEVDYAYNVILDKPTLIALQAVMTFFIIK